MLWAFCCSPILSQNINLKIYGANETETKIIDSISFKKSFPNYNSLLDEINLTHDRLQRIGYIENKVVETKKVNDSVYHSIFDLKQKFYTIYIYYDKSIISQDLIKTVSKDSDDNYFVLPISKIESTLKVINSQLASKGFPFANFNLMNIEKMDAENLKADLLVDQTKERAINKIIIKGYDQFPKSFIKHY